MIFIFFTAVLVLFLLWNWHVIVYRERSPNHMAQAIYRGLIWFLGALWFASRDGGEIPLFIAYFVGFLCAFMFPFNTGLNLLRRRAWNYIGQTSWIDVQGRKWPDAYIMISLLLFIIGLGLLKWPLGY